ncbi:MAG: DivIVA domain-containing protein [Ilumatobacteraceae bacterium]|nr:DivIVA domain-containing protein [Ilumatobacteraceae bacterium]
MAITFSRPDPSSPAAVGSAQFNVERRGYDQGEVRDFLRMVSAELARLQERERFLESEMRAMQTRGLSDPGVLDEATVTTLLGEETARVLSVAREAAQQMRARGAESAERLVREATAESARLREEAEIEVSRRRSDAVTDSESEIELAKQQGREMVNEARAYREKMLSELARRRELAKQQIEQLVRDRDRLMSAFERARLAANDVMGDLSEFDDAADELTRALPEGVIDSTIKNVVQFDREKFEDDESVPVVADITTLPVDESIAMPVEVLEREKVVEPNIETAVVEEKVQPVMRQEVKPEIQPEADLEPDDGHRAKVVQLFGRTSRRLHPSTDAPVSDAPVLELPVAEKPAVVNPKNSSVDDLFAKLRKAGADSVAGSVKQVEPIAKQPMKASPSVVEPRKAPVSAKPDAQIFSKRDDALTPMIEVLAKKLKRVLADEENAMLNYLQSKKAQVALEKVLPTFDSHVQSFVEATSKDLIEAAMAGAQSLSKSLKADLRKKISNTAVMQVMSKKLADEIVLPLRTRIQKCAEKSAGDSNEMSSLIRTVYREWKMQQVDKLVGDVTRLAYSRGAYLVLDAGTKVCWMVDPNGPPCADAEDNSLAGAIARGENFPTGHEHPVIHSGCRCLVVPATR